MLRFEPGFPERTVEILSLRRRLDGECEDSTRLMCLVSIDPFASWLFYLCLTYFDWTHSGSTAWGSLLAIANGVTRLQQTIQFTSKGPLNRCRR